MKLVDEARRLVFRLRSRRDNAYARGDRLTFRKCDRVMRAALRRHNRRANAFYQPLIDEMLEDA